MLIDGINIVASGFNPTRDELKNYVDYVKNKVGGGSMHISVSLCEDGQVNVRWTKHNMPFERIRRITGYLVGTLERWNDAKQAEEHDRVKHEGGDHEK